MRRRSALALAAGYATAASLPSRLTADAATPLPELLTIDWQRGPNLPQGFQDSDGGVIANTLVTVGGFCSGQPLAGKPATYPRGFLRKVWGLSLDGPRAERRWRELPEYPGSARQGLDAAVVDDRLYCWGGFSYDSPFTYRDGYRLSKVEGAWKWEPLPPLPWRLTAQGSCAVGKKLFVVGGADYDGVKGFHTAQDRAGGVKRLGARLLTFDTTDAKAGWKEATACPGTPRFVHAVAAARGHVYVFGGAASAVDPAAGTFTVVDNWRYSPTNDRWQRLADLPVASGNFPSGAIVYRDRYVLLIGGYQYGKVLGPDGATRAVYGTPTRRYADNAMCSDVFVYDTQTDKFGKAPPLPLNNNLPMAVVRGDDLHLIGGEIGAATLDGERYGHHPELHLIGSIRVRESR